MNWWNANDKKKNPLEFALSSAFMRCFLLNGLGSIYVYFYKSSIVLIPKDYLFYRFSILKLDLEKWISCRALALLRLSWENTWIENVHCLHSHSFLPTLGTKPEKKLKIWSFLFSCKDTWTVRQLGSIISNNLGEDLFC